LAPEPHGDSEPEPESEPESEPEPEAESEAESEAVSESEAEPEPDSGGACGRASASHTIPMARASWVWLTVLAFALGCASRDGAGGGDEATTSGSAVTTESSASTETGMAGTSEGSTTGALEACSLAMSRAECEGTTTGSGFPPCAWVEVRRVEDARACSLSEAEARCIDVFFQGAGCLVPNTCGKEDFEVPSIYYRVEGDAVELFARSLCETQPLGWELCTWSEESTGGEADVEPAVCRCLCP
jgi:hypothetical protein